MEVKTERSRPIAAFMAFGTKGDVYPIAAVAAVFACDQRKYEVIFISHSAHEDLAANLAVSNIRYIPVSFLPVLPPPESCENDKSLALSFCSEKNMVTREHRRECLTIMERIYGDGPSMEGDFVLINFFALDGWSLAELFHVRCVVAAPYVVNYTAPTSFQRQFRRELPLLYQYLIEAPDNKLGWKDVIHWMWPLFTEDWGSWRNNELNLSPLPFTDPVTGLPMWHERPSSPLLLYGFSREVVECPDYWPSNSRVSGFWFLPSQWQFSCSSCSNMIDSGGELCSTHTGLQSFLDANLSMPIVFIGLSSVGNLGFLRNPRAFLCILQAAVEITKCRFFLLTAGYEPLDVAVQNFAAEVDSSILSQSISLNYGISLCNDRLFCFSGSIPYNWLFQKCAIAIHHGGSGSTAAALTAGIPQVVCPFMLDQFYWAERMFWLGVAPEPLQRNILLPENCDDVNIREGAYALKNAINCAMSPDIKAQALEISEKISQENGVSEAVRILTEEIAKGSTEAAAALV
ncbi:sterol 3-beta-glucosyltransferase UGT80B1-like isoform X1 [Chenopodium quinoa]|uniref:sterol 3-beta-glucosyltransferase UGT80B1-like isoform X1 n=2 Tax=Chenopodium quinoa TaxID=63459 RepID=UPI000B787E91|nr:sterol 3-beta-glucosyltransferase UGT80B1-like isoform X1 [Chenopodium quinoa]